MVALAVRSGGVASARRLAAASAPDVLAVGHDFQMLYLVAVVLTAEMIKLVSARDGAVLEFPCDHVALPRAPRSVVALDSHLAVAPMRQLPRLHEAWETVIEASILPFPHACQAISRRHGWVTYITSTQLGREG